MFAPFPHFSRVSSTKQNFACQNRAFSRSEAHKNELGLVFSSSSKISKQRIENVSAFIIKGSFWRRLQNWCFITSLLRPNPNTMWLCCTFTAHTHHIDRRDDFMCLVRHQQRQAAAQLSLAQMLRNENKQKNVHAFQVELTYLLTRFTRRWSKVRERDFHFVAFAGS